MKAKEIIQKKIENIRSNEKTRFKFIFSGRIEYNKGIINLIKAFEDVKIDYELHICGSGPLDSLLEDMIKDNNNIFYHGKISSVCLYKLYEECDVLVAPSIWIEPFGLVVVEAMINGCCVIGSNFGGIYEIISKTRGGECFNPNSTQEIAECINSLTTQKIEYYLNCIYETIEYYNIKNTAKNYLAIFSELIDE